MLDVGCLQKKMQCVRERLLETDLYDVNKKYRCQKTRAELWKARTASQVLIVIT